MCKGYYYIRRRMMGGWGVWVGGWVVFVSNLDLIVILYVEEAEITAE